MFVERMKGLSSALVGLLFGILLVVAAVGPAAAEVRASSAGTAGVLEFTYDDGIVRAAHGTAQTGAGATVGRFDPAPSMRPIRLVGHVYDLSRSVVAPNGAVDDFANHGSEFLDDAIRSPAVRPDVSGATAKIQRDMVRRGWTPQMVDDALTTGQSFPATNKLGGYNSPATRYVDPATGQSIVVDNATGEIVHVGGPGFLYD